MAHISCLCKVGHWVNVACEHSLLFSVAMLAASGGNVSWLVGLSVKLYFGTDGNVSATT